MMIQTGKKEAKMDAKIGSTTQLSEALPTGCARFLTIAKTLRLPRQAIASFMALR